MPAGPAARASHARILTCACGSSRERAVGGKHLERERLQRIAGEDRGRLVELPMRRRAAAPQVVVVHRRQVVVHERVGVDQLDGRGERIERRLRRRRRARRSHRRATAARACRRRARNSASRRAVAREPRGRRRERRRASGRLCGGSDRDALRTPSGEARVIIAGHPNTETARPARALVVTESSRTIRASDDDLAYQRGILAGRFSHLRSDDSRACRMRSRS